MAGVRKIEIPAAYATALSYASEVDSRTDAEILAVINQHAEVTSEKNIWSYWHSGLLNMPDWCQRNVAAWQRICGPDWTIRVLNDIPESPNYALRFVSADAVPKCFSKRTMNGTHNGPHAADFLRGALLFSYGGCYMDVTCNLIRNLDRICWSQLEDPSTPFEVCIPCLHSQQTANHFVVAKKNNPFIKRWHEMFCKLWEGRTNSHGLIDHPMLAFARDIDISKSAGKLQPDWSVDTHTVFEYVAQTFCWIRLCMLDREKDGTDGTPGFKPSEYWQNNVLLIDVFEEDWRAEDMIGFEGGGQPLLELLSMHREPRQDTEQYKMAEKLTWSLLANASMQKINHAKGLVRNPLLGTLWSRPENAGKDNEPGTFAELLRYGSVHFVQTRTSITYVKAEPAAVLLQEHYLEA